jgi:hypothetical protein
VPRSQAFAADKTHRRHATILDAIDGCSEAGHQAVTAQSFNQRGAKQVRIAHGIAGRKDPASKPRPNACQRLLDADHFIRT